MHVFLKDKRAQRIVYKQSVKSDVIRSMIYERPGEAGRFQLEEEERPPDRQAITDIIIDMVYEPKLFYKEPVSLYFTILSLNITFRFHARHTHNRSPIGTP